MIKKRLINLLSHAKKHIFLNVFWQWIALFMQIIVVFDIVDFIGKTIRGKIFQKDIYIALSILVIALLVRFICDKMASYHSFAATVDVKRILRKNIYDKLLRLGASYRQSVSTSEVVQMSTEGVEQLEIYFGRYLPQLFYSLLAPITLFVILSFICLKASIVLLICVPLIPISIVAVQKIAKKLLSKYWGIYTGLGDSFLENLQGLTTLKVYQADAKKSEEMDIEAQRFRKITMKVLMMQLNSISIMDIVAYGGAAVGIIVAVYEFASGNITFEDALKIVLIDFEFFIPLRILGSFFHIAMNGMAASDKIFNFLDLEEKEDGSKNIDNGNINITFKDVCFSYVKDRNILEGINLDINKGMFVSLVGESGCGKSTIAKILTGKNSNYLGSVKIGDIELSDIKETEIMKNITLVGYDSYIFKGSVMDNLKMAKPDLEDEEAISVLEKVNLWSFLSNQDGLETKLQERGNNFSGGQRQRLALARAILKDSAIYIFDEATSNIDANSEELIMKVIHDIAKTKTVLLISHRLFNVVKSDRIYMIDSGKIIESGTHEELINFNGKYRKLYDSQKKLESYGREV